MILPNEKTSQKYIYIYHSREGKIKLTLTYVWIAVKYLPSVVRELPLQQGNTKLRPNYVYIFVKKKKVEVLTTRGRMEFRNWRRGGKRGIFTRTILFNDDKRGRGKSVSRVAKAKAVKRGGYRAMPPHKPLLLSVRIQIGPNRYVYDCLRARKVHKL